MGITVLCFASGWVSAHKVSSLEAQSSIPIAVGITSARLRQTDVTSRFFFAWSYFTVIIFPSQYLLTIALFFFFLLKIIGRPDTFNSKCYEEYYNRKNIVASHPTCFKQDISYSKI